MGELLDLTPSNGRNAAIKALVDSSAQLRSYPSRTAAQDAPGQTGSDEDGDSDEQEEAEPAVPDFTGLSNQLEAWLKGIETGDGLPSLAPITLGRIWTRFSYAFDSMRAALVPTRTRYLGVLMHRAIICFLHAVGVECMRVAGRPLPPKVVNNPVESSETFLALLDDASKADENWIAKDTSVSFFYSIFAFPLWGFFLARRDADLGYGQGRTRGTAEVWRHYVKCMEVHNGSMPVYQVRMAAQKGKKPPTFDGLFFILNTLQLQGGPSPKGSRRPKQDAAAVSESQQAEAVPALTAEDETLAEDAGEKVPPAPAAEDATPAEDVGRTAPERLRQRPRPTTPRS